MSRIDPTIPDETAAAVIALGKASAEARRHTSVLASRERGMAERLSRAEGAPAVLLGLVSEAAAAIGARELALSTVWPVSAPTRPAGNAATVDAAQRALVTLDDPRLEAAASAAALDPDICASLIAETEHATDLRIRLDALGCDWRAPEARDEVRKAAEAIEVFLAAGADDTPGAIRARDAISHRQSLLDSVADTVLDLLVKAGIERATVMQARNVCRALAAMPVPYVPAFSDTATLRAAREAVERAIETRKSLTETVSRIDAKVGVAWKQEKPSKLEGAADILAAAEDGRRASASRFAKGLGVNPDSPQAARQLRLMAETLSALSEPALERGTLASFHPLAVEGTAELVALVEHADRGLAWREAVDASESISHAMSRLLASGRHPSGEIARFIADTLAHFLESDARTPFRELLATNRRSLDDLVQAIERISRTPEALVAEGRLAQRLLREHRLAVSRMESDPGRPPSLSVDVLCDASAWRRLAETVLPSSLDPRDARTIASFREALSAAREHALLAERKIQAIGKLVGADAKGWDVPQLTLMTRVQSATVALAALDEARHLVAGVGGFDIVASLEEDSVPGERWAEYLARSEETPVHPPAPEAVRAPSAPARAKPAFDFEDREAWTRTPLRRDASS